MAPHPFNDVSKKDEEDMIRAMHKMLDTMEEVLDIEKNLDELDDLLPDIQDEIDSDSTKLRDLQSTGKMILWMYKDFQSEEDCNMWLESFSNNIIEIRPTADERLSFYVKLSTYNG